MVDVSLAIWLVNLPYRVILIEINLITWFCLFDLEKFMFLFEIRSI